MIENMQNIVAFGMPGGYEWIIILVVAVLIFGRRLPEIARGMGKSLTEFKKGVSEAQNEVTNVIDEDISPIEEAEAEEKEESKKA
jgi:sec-independent protein translocase protein TatA